MPPAEASSDQNQPHLRDAEAPHYPINSGQSESAI